MFVMSDRAFNAWMTDEVKLGAQAGLSVLVIGSNAAAATTQGKRRGRRMGPNPKAPMRGSRWRGRLSNSAPNGTPLIPARFMIDPSLMAQTALVSPFSFARRRPPTWRAIPTRGNDGRVIISAS